MQASEFFLALLCAKNCLTATASRNPSRYFFTTQTPADADEDNPLFQTDAFRMFCFKVLPCSKRFVHDWVTCPFAHPNEKARRRDPRCHSYGSIACPETKQGKACPRGDSCAFSHNIFEFWLHPARYRTQLCNDGASCFRKSCFFAHTCDQLRAPPRKSTDPCSNNPEPCHGVRLQQAMCQSDLPVAPQHLQSPSSFGEDDCLSAQSSHSSVSALNHPPVGHLTAAGLQHQMHYQRTASGAAALQMQMCGRTTEAAMQQQHWVPSGGHAMQRGSSAEDFAGNLPVLEQPAAAPLQLWGQDEQLWGSDQVQPLPLLSLAGMRRALMQQALMQQAQQAQQARERLGQEQQMLYTQLLLQQVQEQLSGAGIGNQPNDAVSQLLLSVGAPLGFGEIMAPGCMAPCWMKG